MQQQYDEGFDLADEPDQMIIDEAFDMIQTILSIYFLPGRRVTSTIYKLFSGSKSAPSFLVINYLGEMHY